jgi:uncharacterized damage-inducible protein DinB/predicted RNase H-like HicB family nuclease
MKPYSIALEIAPDGRCYAHVLDLPGCMLRAPSQEEALRKLPKTIREYHAWLRRHGEPTPPEEAPIEIKVVEVRTDSGPFDPGDTAALFEQDKQPLTPEVMEQHFRLAAHNRTDLLELVRHLPEDLLDWQTTPNTFSIRRVLRHIGNAEEWYVSRIVPPESLPPEWEHDEELPIFKFLEMERRTTIHRLRELDEEQRSQIFYPTHWTTAPGEPWTARKALRRFLEHEREHTVQVREILNARRNSLLAQLAAARADLLYHLIGLEENQLATLPALDTWTVKDVLAHIAAWDRWELQVMQTMASGETPDFSAVKDVDAFNAAVVNQWQKRTLKDVLDELHAARTAWVDWLQEVPLTTFFQPRKYRKYDWSFPGCVEVQKKHDSEHGKQIASWRETQHLEFEPWPKSGAKATLLAALRAQREALQAQITLIPANQRDNRPICGEWTLKDVVGHIADWESWVVEGLRAMAAGQQPRTENVEDVEAWNQAHPGAINPGSRCGRTCRTRGGK